MIDLKLFSFRSLPLVHCSSVLYTRLNQSKSSSIDSSLAIRGDINKIYGLMASSYKLLRSNGSPCDDELQGKNSFQLSNHPMSSTTKQQDYSFQEKNMVNFVSCYDDNDDDKQMYDQNEKMMISHNTSEVLVVTIQDSERNITDCPAIEKASYQTRLAKETGNTNINEGIVASSTTTIPLSLIHI